MVWKFITVDSRKVFKTNANSTVEYSNQATHAWTLISDTMDPNDVDSCRI